MTFLVEAFGKEHYKCLWMYPVASAQINEISSRNNSNRIPKVNPCVNDSTTFSFVVKIYFSLRCYGVIVNNPLMSLYSHAT